MSVPNSKSLQENWSDRFQGALALHRSGQNVDAERIYRELLREKPLDAQLNAALGELLLETERLPEAILHFERCVQAEPQNPEYQNNLGFAHLLNTTGEFGLPHLLKAAELAPHSTLVLVNIGRTYRLIGAVESAVPYLRRALELEPDNPKVLFTSAVIYADLGQFDEAKELYRRLVARGDELAARALRGLAMLTKQTADTSVLPEVLETLEGCGDNPKAQEVLHQAAAKCCIDLKHYDDAFHHLQKAKSLSKSEFSRDGFSQVVERAKSLFTPSLFQRFAGQGVRDRRLVFIVGMPRSGSTLTEQILSMHSQISGVGERSHISIIAKRMGHDSSNPDDYRVAIETIPPDVLRSIGKGYLSLLEGLAPGTSVIADKFLHNFLHVGLIRLLFPEAKFIHCKRNPLDCCLSIYTSPLGQGHSYARDLGDLGWYYNQYRSLMAHWHAVQPGAIYDLQYEDVVEDIEKASKGLLSFLELPWEEQCLDFAANQKPVVTLSKWQVRQPLYKSSVGRWRPYAKHLRPLIEALSA